MARKLILEIVGDTSKLDRSTRHAKQSIEGLGGAVRGLSVSFATLAKSVIFVELLDKALETLHATIHAGTDEIKERLIVQAQIDAALKSTGNVAHLTEEGIDALALSLSNLSGVDDEVIKSGEAVLLTFKNIRNFSGRGNDIFAQATAAALDFATKTGKDVPKAALAVGKALQDPAKAATALRRAQVVLTAEEQKAIKSALAHGDALKAQKLILADLQTRYGGQAKALGETLPGKIAILRQRLRDLSGDLLGALVPGLDFAAEKAVDFVRRFSEASGARAKLNVVFEGARDIGASLVRVVREGIHEGIARLREIDWRALGSEIGRDVRAGVQYGISQLERVDWKAQLDRAAHGVSVALIASLRGLRRALDRVDWQQVGRAIVIGIGVALGAVVRFLVKLDWAKIADQLGRLVTAAVRAAGALYVGIGEEVGKLILRGLVVGFRALGRWLARESLKLALKIIEPFTHLPSWMGEPFRKLKETMQTQLDELTTTTERGGADAAQAYVDGFHHGLDRAPDLPETAKPKTKTTTPPIETELPPPPDPTGTHRNRQRVIDLRNQWFDNRIQRMLDRVQDLNLKQQIAQLAKIAALIRTRIAKTRDVTRQLALEDQLFSVIRQQKAARQALASQTVAALQFDLERAGATTRLSDDIKTLTRINAYLRERIKLEGSTLELSTQLFENRQQLAAVRAQQRQARQFGALGLGPTGDALTQSMAALKRRLPKIADLIKGTPLDTKANRKLLAGIANDLKGTYGKLSQDVRGFIQKFFDDIEDQFKKQAVDQTKFKKTSASAFIARFGIGLTPEQQRRLRAGFETLGVGATTPTRTAQFAGAGGVVVNGDVHVNGVTDVKHLEGQLTKRAKQRPHVRRGAR